MKTRRLVLALGLMITAGPSQAARHTADESGNPLKLRYETKTLTKKLAKGDRFTWN